MSLKDSGVVVASFLKMVWTSVREASSEMLARTLTSAGSAGSIVYEEVDMVVVVECFLKRGQREMCVLKL